MSKATRQIMQVADQYDAETNHNWMVSNLYHGLSVAETVRDEIDLYLDSGAAEEIQPGYIVVY